MTQVKIADLSGPDSVKGTPFRLNVLLFGVEQRTTKNGDPFLSLEFGDATGRFKANLFQRSPDFSYVQTAQPETVWQIEGTVDFFNDRFSPSLGQLRQLSDAEADEKMAELIEVPPESAGELWSDLQKGIESIREPALQLTVKEVFREIGDDFRVAPAAIAMHHAYRHGLLEHTVHMLRAAQALLPLYPEVDADLALAGILLHDIGKVVEYEGTLSFRKSRLGLMQGHVVLGYRIARKHGIKCGLSEVLLDRLEHIILSHQGEMEWGAAAYAATPEAVFVSMVDNLDAKMGMVQMTLRRASPDQKISERIAGLNTALVLKD
jgi:3'-5' exoribonuclease